MVALGIMETTLLGFLTSIVLPAFVSGGTAWLLLKFLSERLLAHRLSKDIERFKSELSERTDVLKTQLGIFAHEQNVALSRIDAQRADAIHCIFGCIRRVMNPVGRIVSGTPYVNGTHQQSVDFYTGNAEAAHAASGELCDALSDRAIYFDNDTYKQVAAFAEESANLVANYLRDLRKARAEGEAASKLLGIAEFGRVQLKEGLESQMTPRTQQLTGKFRVLLGIERSSKTSA
jgi:hypothetical protein